MKLRLKCKVCNYEWIRRSDGLPLRCPNPICQSPYWNRKQNKL